MCIRDRNHSISLKGINEKDLQILIAEDNDSNYSLVKHILKAVSYTHLDVYKRQL